MRSLGCKISFLRTDIFNYVMWRMTVNLALTLQEIFQEWILYKWVSILFQSPFLYILLFFDESWWSRGFYILSLWDFCPSLSSHTISEILILKPSVFDKKFNLMGEKR